MAFDRIVSLDLTEEKFNYDGDFRPADWFRDCYGIVRDPNVPVEKVVLRAFGKEAYIFGTCPCIIARRRLILPRKNATFAKN